MTLVTLDSNLSNTPQFVESMFDTDVRNYSLIPTAAQANLDYASFANSSSQSTVQRSWLAAWKTAQNAPTSTTFNSSDFALMVFLSLYLEGNSLSLCAPSLIFQSMMGDTDMAIYSSDGYSRIPFRSNAGDWNYSTVQFFLNYLYFGAHFVVVSSPNDTNEDIALFYESFVDGSSLTTSWDKVNSHYSASTWVNTSGYYYLDITSDSEPSSDPLIASFLVGKTSDTNKTNTFFQLEGWQSHFPYVAQWHTADYSAHEDTLWNYSTYGASPYSEKRSTTIFLAPDDFDLTQDPTTHMPLYEGAGSLQSWMNPNLLQLG